VRGKRVSVIGVQIFQVLDELFDFQLGEGVLITKLHKRFGSHRKIDESMLWRGIVSADNCLLCKKSL
jgi:hypothetical protein